MSKSIDEQIRETEQKLKDLKTKKHLDELKDKAEKFDSLYVEYSDLLKWCKGTPLADDSKSIYDLYLASKNQSN